MRCRSCFNEIKLVGYVQFAPDYETDTILDGIIELNICSNLDCGILSGKIVKESENKKGESDAEKTK